MNQEFWQTLFLTAQLASITTLLLLVTGLPFARFLADTRSKIKPVLEALVSMPLVLPPTVLGFYLLIAFSPDSFLGKWLNDTFDLRLVFSFPGLVIGSMIYSLPFMIHPIQAGLESLPKSLSEAAYTLGKSRWQTFRYVLLPNIRSSIITGVVLTFAHTIGEFGVILMIGGNIPGETRVASIAVYDEVESLNFAQANQYAAVLFVFSFIMLLFVYGINRKVPTVLR